MPNPTNRRFQNLAACSLALLLTSCSSETQLTTTESASASHTPQEYPILDAGIVFTDREHRIAFPLEPYGITQSEQIKSIKTSCECVMATAVGYEDAGEQVAIEFAFASHALPSKCVQRLLIQTTILTISDTEIVVSMKVLLVGIETCNRKPDC